LLWLSGRKINLRDFRLDDLEAYAYWLSSGHAWQKSDGPFYPDLTPEEIDDVIAEMRRKIEKKQFSALRVTVAIADAETDQFIGRVARYWISVETYWTAIGISVYDPAHWRKGYGYEALGLWSDYLFHQERAFARLDLRTWSGNIGMQRLAEKLGYQLEARFRNARIVGGKYYDELGYGVLREEWETRYPQGFASHLKNRNNGK